MKPHELIKNLREAAGLKQFVLADKLGTGRPNYGRKENGKVPFTADELLQVLEHLKSYLPAETYQNGLEALLGQQEPIIKEDKKHPVPIDTVTRIIFNAMERSGETMTPEEIKKVAKICREYLDDSQQSRQGEYEKISSQFDNPEDAGEFISLMRKLEQLSIKDYYKYLGEIKGLVKHLESLTENQRPDQKNSKAI